MYGTWIWITQPALKSVASHGSFFIMQQLYDLMLLLLLFTGAVSGGLSTLKSNLRSLTRKAQPNGLAALKNVGLTVLLLNQVSSYRSSS